MKKQLILGLIIIILIVIIFQGSIGNNDFQNEQTSIYDFKSYIDLNDNIHLIWEQKTCSNNDSNNGYYYKKINSKGNTIINNFKFANTTDFWSPRLITDSDGNAIIYNIYTDELIKINKNLSNIEIKNNFFENLFGGRNRPILRMDSENCLYCINPMSTQPRFAKIDYDGNLIISKNSNEFLVGNNYSSGYISVGDMEFDNDGNIHIICEYESFEDNESELSYSKYDSEGNILINLTPVKPRKNKTTTFFPFLEIDSNDDIHVYWDKYYYKLDNNGTAISQKMFLKNISLIKHPAQYPPRDFCLIKDVNGKYVVLGSDGLVDSKNNVYLIWNNNDNIYLRKLDKNLKVLIEKKTVVSLNKDSLFNINSDLCKFIIPVSIFLIIGIVIKKKVTNKGVKKRLKK